MSVQKESVFAPHIPLDPFNTRRDWQFASVLSKSLLSVQRFGDILLRPCYCRFSSVVYGLCRFQYDKRVIACVSFYSFCRAVKIAA